MYVFYLYKLTQIMYEYSIIQKTFCSRNFLIYRWCRVDTGVNLYFRISPRTFVKTMKYPNWILRSKEESDSRKNPEDENLASGSYFKQFTPCSHSDVQCWGYSLSKSLSYFLNTLEPEGGMKLMWQTK